MSEGEKNIYHFSGKYGWIHPDSIHFNDLEVLGDKYLHYKVSKIKIWTGKKDNNKDIVVGVEFFYKSLVDGKEISGGEHKGKNSDKVDQFELGQNEYIVDFHIRIDTEVTQLGFTTNKGKTFLKGGEAGENKITQIKDGNNICFAIFGCFNNELQSCGVLYYNKKLYMKMLFSGYFELRYFLKKKEDFRKNALEKEQSLDKTSQILLKTCLLPDTAFNSVIKYCLS